jgi:Mg2+ and Co2+ transporter CorA
MVDTNRELVAAAAEAYRSMVSLKISQINLRLSVVMERLTLVATIFMPLTFIVGIYGMNLSGMPEFGWVWFYPLLLVVMFLVGASQWFYFRRKGWLTDLRQAERESAVENHYGDVPPVENEPVPEPVTPEGANGSQ